MQLYRISLGNCLPCLIHSVCGGADHDQTMVFGEIPAVSGSFLVIGGARDVSVTPGMEG